MALHPKPEPELSCGLPPGPDFADLAVLAEELDYARVWIYVARELCAFASARVSAAHA